MCRRVECAKCGRPTFAGCGAHVEQVLGDVPPAARCHCREERAQEGAKEGAKERAKEGAKTAGLDQPAGARRPRSWLKNLLGR